MEKIIETIPGDTPGLSYSLTRLAFGGSDGDAPSAYLQAALHGDELPGVAALHVLIPLLMKADAEGRIRGRITIVPFANPIGLGQYLWGEPQGRFAFGTRVNFNRDFPLVETAYPPTIDSAAPGLSTDQRLKARLLQLSLGHDIVLDLHCDDQSLSYFYAPAALWPHMTDLAACLDSQAVLLFDAGTDASFDDANFHPYAAAPADVARFADRAIATVELRGRPDVDPVFASHDGEGLYRFLVGRGLVEDERIRPPVAFSGPAVLQSWVEMPRAPTGGVVLFHAGPGEWVEAGQLLAEIVSRPGDTDGTTEIRAEAPGMVLTRISVRAVPAGAGLMKIVGSAPWRAASAAGALES